MMGDTLFSTKIGAPNLLASEHGFVVPDSTSSIGLEAIAVPFPSSRQTRLSGLDALSPHFDTIIRKETSKVSPSPIGGKVQIGKLSNPADNLSTEELTPKHITELFSGSHPFLGAFSMSPTLSHHDGPRSLGFAERFDMDDVEEMQGFAAEFVDDGSVPSFEEDIFGMEPVETLQTASGFQFEMAGSGQADQQPYIEHPYGEHPSRTLFVRNINSSVEDSELLELFEAYGAIRSLYSQCKHRGFVMISYYDIRHAKNAMRHLQGKILRRRKLDIHYSIPKDNPPEKDQNQGTLVVFNLDPAITNDELKVLFGQFGEIKEIRETPNKKHHKFIEFYDVRDAEQALRSLNKTEVKGKKIKIEPSRPGGQRRALMQQQSTTGINIPTPPITVTSPPLSDSEQTHSLPASPPPFHQPPFPGFPSSAPSTFQGQVVKIRPVTPPFPPRQGTPQQSPQVTPPMSPTLRVQTQASVIQNALLSPRGVSPTFGFSPPRPSSPASLKSPENLRRTRASQDEDKSNYILDLDRVQAGHDPRTTLMIRNIPNKYTQKMLLQAVDEKFKGTYDFFYLPIDFKNKCNVGYAFINFLSPSFIVPFHIDFNNKKWERFNSEKVCEITYARIQGKSALVSHFQNSSLMCEDKKCRPIIFHSNGPNIGEQEPFPVGPHIRKRSTTNTT